MLGFLLAAGLKKRIRKGLAGKSWLERTIELMNVEIHKQKWGFSLARWYCKTDCFFIFPRQESDV